MPKIAVRFRLDKPICLIDYSGDTGRTVRREAGLYDLEMIANPSSGVPGAAEWLVLAGTTLGAAELLWRDKGDYLDESSAVEVFALESD